MPFWIIRFAQPTEVTALEVGGQDTSTLIRSRKSAIGPDLPAPAGPAFQSTGRRWQIRPADEIEIGHSPSLGAIFLGEHPRGNCVWIKGGLDHQLL